MAMLAMGAETLAFGGGGGARSARSSRSSRSSRPPSAGPEKTGRTSLRSSLTQAFDQLDTDKDGVLTSEEIHRGVSLGLIRPSRELELVQLHGLLESQRRDAAGVGATAVASLVDSASAEDFTDVMADLVLFGLPRRMQVLEGADEEEGMVDTAAPALVEGRLPSTSAPAAPETPADSRAVDRLASAPSTGVLSQAGHDGDRPHSAVAEDAARLAGDDPGVAAADSIVEDDAEVASARASNHVPAADLGDGGRPCRAEGSAAMGVSAVVDAAPADAMGSMPSELASVRAVRSTPHGLVSAEGAGATPSDPASAEVAVGATPSELAESAAGATPSDPASAEAVGSTTSELAAAAVGATPSELAVAEAVGAMPSELRRTSSKVCGRCQAEYAGFGEVCPACRKLGKVGSSHQCTTCQSFFIGFGDVCGDCKAPEADDEELKGTLMYFAASLMGGRHGKAIAKTARMRARAP